MNSRVFMCAATVLLFWGGAGARAGFLRIDDTSDTGIVIGANDFEGGLFINGQPFQSGLAHPATGTFPESQGAITFDGRWTVPGGVTPSSHIVYFAEAQDPTLVSDILRYDVSQDQTSNFAHITGTFESDVTGDLGPVPAGVVPFIEDGSDVDASQPFLTFIVSSSPDPAVPEPASLALFSLGIAGLGGLAYRRRKRAAVR